MAEGWVLKAKLVRSKRFRRLYDKPFSQLVYCLLIAAKDSWGLHPADEDSLKMSLGPFDKRDPAEYAAAVADLAQVGLIRVWTHQGDPWLYVEGHEREHTSVLKRRGKCPPVEIPETSQTDAVCSSLQHSAAVCSSVQQSAADCCLIGSDWNGLKGREGKQLQQSSLSSSSSRTDLDESTQTPTPVKRGPVSPVGGNPPSHHGKATRGREHTPSGCPSQMDAPGALTQLHDKRPIGDEHDQILALLHEYQQAWNLEEFPSLPEHDNKMRVLEALRHPALGLEKCKAAVRGHKKVAGSPESPHGKDFRHAFPPASIGGRKAANKVDINRVEEFARLGGAAKPNRNKWLKVEREGKVWEINPHTKEERMVES